jgi:hypothetical protein
MNPNSDPTHKFIFLLIVKNTEFYNRRYDVAKAFYYLIRNPLAKANGKRNSRFLLPMASANGLAIRKEEWL